MKNRKIIKLDADDIMEILLEHYQEAFDKAYAKGIILGAEYKELRFIAVFGEEQDEELKKLDLKKIDQQMDYNGEHSFFRNV